ncbi:MAG: hypothetical protein K2J37_04565 [Ruminococcus sp.]|nr:hypothetical protein [Ruminococcus sp.]MDE6785197.1 hypothetical protein [Ruminococcus sp.]
MKNIKRIISITAVVYLMILMLPTIVFSASAGSETDNYAKGWSGNASDSVVFDGPDFFTAGTESEINAVIQSAAAELEMNILVFMASPEYAMTNSETKKFADSAYEEAFGKDTDGVIFFMDFTEEKPAYDYISTSGKAIVYYQNHIDDIFDEVYNYLPSSSVTDYTLYTDEIKSGIECFVEQLKHYGRENSSYYYDRDTGNYVYFRNGEVVISSRKPFRMRLKALLFAVPLGIIAALIYFFSMKNTYKFKSSANPKAYVSPQDTQFTCRNDRFIRTYTTKHKIESSSSGGHSGGGHSSGGSHGGGGSRR